MIKIANKGNLFGVIEMDILGVCGDFVGAYV